VALVAREERKKRAQIFPAEWRRASLGKSRLSLARFSWVAAAGKAGVAAKKKKDAAWMTWEGGTDLERGILWKMSCIAAQFARELIEAKLERLTATTRSEDGEERVTSDHGVMLLRTMTPLLDYEVVWPHNLSPPHGRHLEQGGELQVRLLQELIRRHRRRRAGLGQVAFDRVWPEEAVRGGRTVLLELRREKNVVAFVPRKSADGKAEYDAWWCEMSDFKERKCATVRRVVTGYIMDATAKLPKNPSGLTQRILVSEPNEENYDDFNKEKARTRFVPLWTLEEMCALQGHSSELEDSQLDPAELLQRFFIFGWPSALRVFEQGDF
jgi:hypothetical protein